MGLRNTSGSIAFKLDCPEPDWATDDAVYNFRLPDAHRVQGVTLLARKNADGTLYIEASDNLEAAKFNLPVGLAAQGLEVSVSWDHGEVILYLDGVRVGGVTCLGGPGLLN